MDDLTDQKKQLRKQIRKIKKSFSAENRISHSKSVMSKIEACKEFIKAKTIFIYWAMDDEVDTRYFIVKWHHEKTFILPTIKDNELELKEFYGVENLKDGDLYSIPEPVGTPFYDIHEIDLAIIPGVAFDKENNRMGRGKAYYDKILKQIKGRSFLIGICFDFQIVGSVPVEEHDIPMDKVIHS